MNQKIVSFVRKIYWKYPIFRPGLGLIHRTFFIKPKFSGWGMKTEAELPWNDEYVGDIFRQASIDIKKNFEFSKNTTGTNKNNVDTLLWRHWIVSHSVLHAIKFADSVNYNFVECGVGDGMTSFFALREISSQKTISKPTMHLYDSWDMMKKESLLENESHYVGRYANLDINITKKNLAEFSDIVIYHRGYMPESFETLPKSPDSIVYLSIDLNSAKPTLATLEYFFPRLAKGGTILFDDYGQEGYQDTKKAIDKFFSNKPGILFKLPTSQTIYYR